MNSISDVPPNLEMLLDIPVAVTIELGSCSLAMKEVLQLAPGSVIQLDKAADAPLELRVNKKTVARGEVVVMDGKLGFKITEMVS